MTRRSVKTRTPRPIQFGLALTFFWFATILFSVGAGVFRGTGSWTTLIVVTIITICGWAVIFRLQREQNAAGKTLEDLRAMSPDVFEEWVAVRFRDLGYAVELTGTNGDHGVDLIARRNGQIAVIQCKNYRVWSVGEPKLRDLYGAMNDFGASQAFLVTSGKLTRPAREWIAGKPIEVWDGEYVAQLSSRLGRSKTANAVTARSDLPVAQRTVTRLEDAPVESIIPTTAKLCPSCGSPLVQRQNRRTGDGFWGCATYPKCRYTRPLNSTPT